MINKKQIITENNHKLSAYAHKCLRKIIARNGANRCRDGGSLISSLKVPASVIEQLQRRDLIAGSATAGLVATEVGCAYIRRLDAMPGAGRARMAGPRKDGKAPANPYAGQHRIVVLSEVKEGNSWRKVRRNVAETPLGWLLKRRGRDGEPLISQALYDAGERLRGDFELAQLAPGITRNYDALPSVAGRKGQIPQLDPTEMQMAAKRRYGNAIEATGNGLAGILVRICCHLEGLEEAERTLGWPSRSAKIVLRIALERLCEHYEGKKMSARRHS